MYAQLGNIKFTGLKGFDSFQSKKSSQLAEHARIDGKPRLQKTGDALEEISLSIQLHSSFCNPETEIEALESARSAGSILPFINGAGELYGSYVISELEKTIKHTTPTGQIVLCSLAITLKEVYDEDPEKTEAALAKRTAFANSANQPSTRDNFSQLQGAGLSAMVKLNESRSQAVVAETLVLKAENVPSTEADSLTRASNALTASKDAMGTFKDRASGIQDQINNWSTLEANINNALTYADAALVAVAANDVPTAKAAARNLSISITGVSAESASIVSLTAIRRI